MQWRQLYIYISQRKRKKFHKQVREAEICIQRLVMSWPCNLPKVVYDSPESFLHRTMLEGLSPTARCILTITRETLVQKANIITR